MLGLTKVFTGAEEEGMTKKKKVEKREDLPLHTRLSGFSH